MTNLREAAQQALEALEDWDSPVALPAIIALRAALAQEQAEPVQEPVCDKDPRGCYSVRCQLGRMCKHAAPPQRKPLDDLAIADIYTKWDATPGTSMADFARAIERAHGIGGQDE